MIISIIITCLLYQNISEITFCEIGRDITAFYKKKGFMKKVIAQEEFMSVLCQSHDFKFDINKDTLYIIHSEDFPSASMRYHVKCGGILKNGDYSFSDKVLTPSEDISFTKYIMSLVYKWDTLGIRKGEKESDNFAPRNYVYACRVFYSHGKQKIEVVKFKDIFRHGKD